MDWQEYVVISIERELDELVAKVEMRNAEAERELETPPGRRWYPSDTRFEFSAFNNTDYWVGRRFMLVPIEMVLQAEEADPNNGS